jgi:hypothetical protein
MKSKEPRVKLTVTGQRDTTVRLPQVAYTVGFPLSGFTVYEGQWSWTSNPARAEVVR